MRQAVTICHDLSWSRALLLRGGRRRLPLTVDAVGQDWTVFASPRGASRDDCGDVAPRFCHRQRAPQALIRFRAVKQCRRLLGPSGAIWRECPAERIKLPGLAILSGGPGECPSGQNSAPCRVRCRRPERNFCTHPWESCQVQKVEDRRSPPCRQSQGADLHSPGAIPPPSGCTRKVAEDISTAPGRHSGTSREVATGFCHPIKKGKGR
jgi:hypothetical protein